MVYHLAAEVNHIKRYQDLLLANVNSTREIIKFSQVGRGKIINFASTMGAASKLDIYGCYEECFPDDSKQENFSMGYLQSKYEAEKILSNVGNVNIFRLGYLSGSARTGISLHEKNQLMLFIKSCIQLGYAPKIKRTLNLTAVDFATQVMAHQHFLNNGLEVLHLANNHSLITWEHLIAYLNEQGYHIELSDMQSWQQKLIQSGRENALFPMLLTYRRKDAEERIIRFGKNIHNYCFEKMEAFCVSNNIQLPEVTTDYLNSIFSYLREVNFLPEPNLLQSKKNKEKQCQIK